MDRTIKMVDRHGEAFDVPGYMVSRHWAMTKNKGGPAWSLTHVPSAGIIGAWDEGTCLELSGILTVPPECDIDVDAAKLSAASGFRHWCILVRDSGDKIHAARATERLAEHVKGHQLFRVDVTRETFATVFVVAKDRAEAERMAAKADLFFDDSDTNTVAMPVRSLINRGLDEEVEAPKGFPTATIGEVAKALGIPLSEDGK